MPTEPVFLRWEHTTPPHHKFYEMEVELSLFFGVPQSLEQKTPLRAFLLFRVA